MEGRQGKDQNVSLVSVRVNTRTNLSNSSHHHHKRGFGTWTLAAASLNRRRSAVYFCCSSDSCVCTRAFSSIFRWSSSVCHTQCRRRHKAGEEEEEGERGDGESRRRKAGGGKQEGRGSSVNIGRGHPRKQTKGIVAHTPTWTAMASFSLASCPFFDPLLEDCTLTTTSRECKKA